MLEECATEERSSVVRFMWTKGLNAKDAHNEMFPVYGGKCLSCKAAYDWMTNASMMTKRLKRKCGNG
jgi:hypothetical protein